MERDEQILANQQAYDMHELYNKYSAMLYGYIYEVVQDVNLAEKQLISFCSTIKHQLHSLNADGENAWCQLQRLLKKHLLNNNIPIERDIMVSHGGNKYLGMMSNEQRYVFYRVYYHGQTTAELSCILNKPEEQVRRDLKEAFTILRRQA